MQLHLVVGATVLLINRARRAVVLTRQFRLPTYVNGNTSGLLIEAAGGLLDDADPIMLLQHAALTIFQPPRTLRSIDGDI